MRHVGCKLIFRFLILVGAFDGLSSFQYHTGLKCQFHSTPCHLNEFRKRFSIRSLQFASLSLSSNGNTDKDAEVDSHQDNGTEKYATLAVLVAMFACNQWCRQALFYLCDFSAASSSFKHINADLAFNKDQYALLASVLFSLPFTALSFATGAASDKYNRRDILFLSCLGWSLSTIAQYVAQSFQDVAWSRITLAASQSFYNPAAYTLLSELFPPQQLGTVNGIFSGGIFFGGALASLSVLFDRSVGWRNTVLGIGLISLFTGLISLAIVRDPRPPLITSPKHTDNGADQSAKPNPFNTIRSELQDLFSSSTVKLVYAASTLRFTAGLTLLVWKAPFVYSAFPDAEGLFASSNAIIVGVGGLASSILGGYISDAWAKKSVTPDMDPVKVSERFQTIRSTVATIGCFGAAPFLLAFLYSPTAETALLRLVLEYLFAEVWLGPTLAVLLDAVRKERRGLAQGIFSTLVALGNVGPWLVGYLMQSVGMPLGTALAAVAVSCYIGAGLLFAVVAISQRRP